MATRARNEGSIYRQQTDGRWVAAISVGYRNGRRRRKKCFGATRGAVAAQLTHALHDHQHGLPVAPDRQTVGTLLTRWLEDSVKPSVRPTTYRSYQQLVDLHLTPGLGRYPLAKLTPPPPGADLSQRPAPRRTDPHVVSGPGVPADANAAHGPVHPRCAPAGAQSGDALGSGLAQCRDPGDPAAGHPTGRYESCGPATSARPMFLAADGLLPCMAKPAPAFAAMAAAW